MAAIVDGMECNERVYKFLLGELSWSGWGESNDLFIKLTQEFNNYRFSMREHIKTCVVDLGRLQRGPYFLSVADELLIRHREMDLFFQTFYKNKALLEIARQCEELVREKERQGHTVPSMPTLKIFLPFPELRCNLTTYSVPITVLCQTIGTHYDLHSDRELSYIHALLSQEIEGKTNILHSSVHMVEYNERPFAQPRYPPLPTGLFTPRISLLTYVRQLFADMSDSESSSDDMFSDSEDSESDCSPTPSPQLSPVRTASEETINYSEFYDSGISDDPMDYVEANRTTPARMAQRKRQNAVKSSRPMVPSKPQKCKRQTSDPDYMPSSKRHRS